MFQIDEMYQFGYVNDCSRTYFYMHNGVRADITNHELQFNQWEMYTGTYNYDSGTATIYSTATS